MEEKRSEAGTSPAAGAESPASEPSSSRRRAGGQKRKASNLGGSNSSSGQSKRITREKASLSHPPIHNGPLTRARQGPNNLAASAPAPQGGATAPVKKLNEQAVPAAEKPSKESELEALEAAMEAEFEAIRSRGANAHVVPSHCGWFSWTKVHPVEEHTLPSFFNGKSEARTPDMYMEIRNWIMKKFHSNTNTQIESKDILELEVGDLEARQEVIEFLDHWGLINFNPFAPTDSVVPCVDNDGAAKRDSLVEKLFRFETPQLCLPVVPKTNLTTPAVPSGFFPESAIAEELARAEGPSVEYHCNSCSADCSRKRYHCQKQADFDLCTDCFNNGKFGSGMSSLDFILMEPAEAPGLSSGKWTDQETLLLLEALELYKENWNEIAEHVATKTKAQCILHFLQMPIEDAFVDGDVDIDASSKENADPAFTSSDSSVPKDALESKEIKTGASEGQPLTSPVETSNTEDTNEVKVGEESRPEDASEVKVGQETLGPAETGEGKVEQDVGENWALKALREAFEAVGYPPAPDNTLSFAEVGNPVMALAVFLAQLVGPDVAVASAHNSLKSISGSSSGIQLAARHCVLLEDPPDDKKEPIGSERDAQEDGNLEGRNEKGDNSPSVLDDRDLSNGHNNKKNKDCAPEETQDGESTGKPDAAKEEDVIACEEVGQHNVDDTSNSDFPKDHPQDTMKESDDLTSKVELPPSSGEEPQERSSVGEPSQPAEEPKDLRMVSDSPSAKKNELQQPVPSDSAIEPPQPTEEPRDADMLSDSLPLEKNGPNQPVTTSSVGKPPQPSEAPMDVDIVSDSLPSEKNEPQEPVTTNSVEELSQPTEAPKDVAMVSDYLPSKKNESQQPVTTNSVVENGASEDQIEDDKKVKPEISEKKNENKFDKVKRAAVTALSAAAVKAKLLANQEEDQIRQLAAFLIEKQLQKLETKLAFFNEMEHVVMRVREQLDRSRQRLYHERAQIIAARLGAPASSSRAMPPSLATNRIATNFANSVARLPMGMTSQRPQMLRPMGTAASTPSNPFTSNTAAGSSVRPPGQDKLSSVGTK